MATKIKKEVTQEQNNQLSITHAKRINLAYMKARQSFLDDSWSFVAECDELFLALTPKLLSRTGKTTSNLTWRQDIIGECKRKIVKSFEKFNPERGTPSGLIGTIINNECRTFKYYLGRGIERREKIHVEENYKAEIESGIMNIQLESWYKDMDIELGYETQEVSDEVKEVKKAKESRKVKKARKFKEATPKRLRGCPYVI